MFVYLDPRRDEVSVPPWFRKQPQLVLQFGLQLPVPIPDMRVDEEGVFGTLSFNRQPFLCHIPWSGVFALVGDDGMGMVWEEDLPEEIAAEVEAGFSKAAPKRPSLRAIAGGKSDDPSSDAAGDTSTDDAVPAGEGKRRGLSVAPAAAPDPRTVEGSESNSDPADETDRAATDAEPTDAEPTEPTDTQPAGSEGDDEPPKRPHLRLIK